MLWSEIASKLEPKNFEDGLNDARRREVNQLAYQINREYREGVDIANQLIANFGVPPTERVNKTREPANRAVKLS